MSMSFGNFRFQGPMPLFQFRKMRFYGHIGLLSQSRWAGRPSSSARTAVCYSCIQSRVCLATAKLYGANFREVLLFQHRFTSEVGWRASASDIRFGWPPISNGGLNLWFYGPLRQQAGTRNECRTPT